MPGTRELYCPRFQERGIESKDEKEIWKGEKGGQRRRGGDGRDGRRKEEYHGVRRILKDIRVKKGRGERERGSDKESGIEGRFSRKYGGVGEELLEVRREGEKKRRKGLGMDIKSDGGGREEREERCGREKQ